jgi:OOP family OmpA-OmpF porin
MKKIIFALCSFAFIATSQTQAQAQESYYVGAGVTSTKFDVNINLGSITNQNSVSKTGSKFFAGMALDKTWAVEVAYIDLGSNSTDWKLSGRSGTAKLGVTSQYLAAKGSAPINEQFSLFGKLGITRTQFKQSGFPSGGDETKTGAYGAIGVDFSLSKNIALSLEWERLGASSSYAKINKGNLSSTLRFIF